MEFTTLDGFVGSHSSFHDLQESVAVTCDSDSGSLQTRISHASPTPGSVPYPTGGRRHSRFLHLAFIPPLSCLFHSKVTLSLLLELVEG